MCCEDCCGSCTCVACVGFGRDEQLRLQYSPVVLAALFASHLVLFFRSAPIRDCAVSDWFAVGNCTAACGGGVLHQRRRVIQRATNGGQDCPSLYQSIPCNTLPCTHDGVPEDAAALTDKPTHDVPSQGWSKENSERAKESLYDRPGSQYPGSSTVGRTIEELCLCCTASYLSCQYNCMTLTHQTHPHARLLHLQLKY